ncbi:MAG: hypothetical protein ACPG61_07110 [Paracoccaceae bacterium]
MLRFLPSGLALLAVGMFVWWVVDLRSDNAALTLTLAQRDAALATMAQERALSRDAARVAQIERARQAVAAAKYETVRDAFRKGNFDAPLPDDFRDLVTCLLRRSAGRDAPDCP